MSGSVANAAAEAAPAVEWEDPRDATVAWTLARLHYPRPITVLTHDLRRLSQDTGMSRADAALERPIERLQRRINGYLYRGARPLELPAAELATRKLRAEARYVSLARRAGEVWSGMLPEIEALLAAFDAVPLEQLDRRELATELALATTRFARLWEIHFLVMPPALTAMELFTELYRELFEDATQLDALRLLQGEDSKTVEAARSLWALAAAARADRPVADVLVSAAPEDLAQAIETAPEAAAFRALFNEHLTRYGRRGITMDPAEPSVIERPGAVLGEIRELLASGRDPAEQLATVRRERDDAVSAARERIRWYPQPVRDEFEVLLRSAQDAVRIQETHNFYIDFPTSFLMRIRAQAAARLLVADGVIPEVDDVFHLRLVELADALLGHPAADLRGRIDARRQELERAARIDPPRSLGAPSPGAGTSIVDRATLSFAGAPPPPSEHGIVRGHPGSAGRARGIARVAHTPAEAERIAAGEILVTQMTAAPWTPLFARIRALVTDAGGALSHSAIVAREYGIPAVVGTGHGTSSIRDGEEIEVDGDAGIVRIVGAA
ncbi:MAG TPA: PEP-utilizing enzyme [Candidatus Limnocylindria bacterium]|nr:PEP-utilizing enzyme [Candidatus Limnocylindria bacterium]